MSHLQLLTLICIFSSSLCMGKIILNPEESSDGERAKRTNILDTDKHSKKLDKQFRKDYRQTNPRPQRKKPKPGPEANNQCNNKSSLHKILPYLICANNK